MKQKKSKIKFLGESKQNNFVSIFLTGEQIQQLKKGRTSIKLDQNQLFRVALAFGWEKFPWEKMGDFCGRRIPSPRGRRGRVSNRVRDQALHDEYKRQRQKGEKRDKIIDIIYERQTVLLYDVFGNFKVNKKVKMGRDRILRICNSKRK